MRVPHLTDTGFNHAYTYAGYRYDKETGLYFLNARYYAPGIGRFLTKDTWKGAATDPGTLNRYSYTHGDPVNLYDPSGHWDDVTGGPEARNMSSQLGVGSSNNTIGIGAQAVRSGIEGVADGVVANKSINNLKETEETIVRMPSFEPAMDLRYGPRLR